MPSGPWSSRECGDICVSRGREPAVGGIGLTPEPRSGGTEMGNRIVLGVGRCVQK